MRSTVDPGSPHSTHRLSKLSRAGMALGEVQRAEVVPLGLDLGALRHREAHADEDVLEPLPGLGDEVGVTQAARGHDLGEVEPFGLELRGPVVVGEARAGGLERRRSTSPTASLSARPTARRSSGSRPPSALRSSMKAERRPSSSTSSAFSSSELPAAASRSSASPARRRPPDRAARSRPSTLPDRSRALPSRFADRSPAPGRSRRVGRPRAWRWRTASKSGDRGRHGHVEGLGPARASGSTAGRRGRPTRSGGRPRASPPDDQGHRAAAGRPRRAAGRRRDDQAHRRAAATPAAAPSGSATLDDANPEQRPGGGPHDLRRQRVGAGAGEDDGVRAGGVGGAQHACPRCPDRPRRRGRAPAAPARVPRRSERAPEASRRPARARDHGRDALATVRVADAVEAAGRHPGRAGPARPRRASRSA